MGIHVVTTVRFDRARLSPDDQISVMLSSGKRLTLVGVRNQSLPPFEVPELTRDSSSVRDAVAHVERIHDTDPNLDSGRRGSLHFYVQNRPCVGRRLKVTVQIRVPYPSSFYVGTVDVDFGRVVSIEKL